GFYVKVDVTIFYRIIDPYKVAQILGRTPEEFMQNGIAKKAESVLKDAFGKLTTEEFYNSPLRLAQAIDAKKLFNEKVLQEGLQVEHVLVRYFEYSEEIQKNIEEKKLKDQLVFKEQSEAKAKKEGAELKKVKAEGVATIKVELEKGNAYVVRKNAQKNAYVRKKKAAGNLKLKLAEATKTRKINEAYKHKGAKRIVGLEMAKVLNNLELIVIPSDGKNGFNPIDLDKNLILFGTKEK
ncbi:SPFH domain-containing protein, partial [Candidatus Margulisiibacteriota bacterium]